MGVARRYLDTLVAKQATDDRQRQASADGKACETVAQIVDAHVVEAGERPNAPPWFLQVDQVLARHFAGDDIGIAVLASQVGHSSWAGALRGMNLAPCWSVLCFSKTSRPMSRSTLVHSKVRISPSRQPVKINNRIAAAIYAQQWRCRSYLKSQTKKIGSAQEIGLYSFICLPSQPPWI